MTLEEMIADHEKAIENHEMMKNQMKEIFRMMDVINNCIYHADPGASSTLAMLYESMRESAGRFNDVMYRESSEILDKRNTLKGLTNE